MPLSSTRTSLICPQNDAENVTIAQIARRLDIDIHISEQRSWFCPLFREPPATFEKLQKDVIIVEMPGEAEEEQLRAKGHTVHVVDHHDYHSLGLHRWAARSSIQQFADLIGYTLNNDEQIVSWNDQEYIYGLMQRNVTWEKQRWVRRFDLLSQGYSEEELQRAKKEVQGVQKLSNGVYQYVVSHNRFSALLDEHVFAVEGRRTNVWCIGKSSENGISYFCTGEEKLIHALMPLGGFSKLSNEEYGIWGGHEQGVEAVDLQAAEAIIRSLQLQWK